ncbi:cyclin-domain-containing protein [Fennellomyces sp. T-0311]|nr:cyclin-domain-containing protein [Fennellomyces sp. T-0311]
MSSAPFQFDLARHPTKDTIKMLTSLLEKVTKANDRMHPTTTSPGDPALPPRHGRPRSLSLTSPYNCFQSKALPSISIHAYLSRILKYCPCANECFLALLVYFDRLSKSTAHRQPLRIDSYNIHRLVISGVMVASKLFSDVFFTNTRYAKVGGLPVNELNLLEVEFLALNNYSLFVTVDELQHYGDQLLLHWMREQEGYIDSRVQPRQLAMREASHTEPAPEQNQDDDYIHVNKVARHLSIDKGDNRHESNKDLHRKSDEIDKHRCFKRPSFTQQDGTSSQHLPTPPDSSSPTNAISPSPSSSHDSSRSLRYRQDNTPSHPKFYPAVS